MKQIPGSIVAVTIVASSVFAPLCTATPSVVPPVDLSFEWKDKNGKVVPDSEDRKSKNNFGAQLFLTKNKDLWDQWATLLPQVAPKITTLSGPVKINEPIFIVLIYANPKVDNGLINVTCDITITKPDGKQSHPPVATGHKGKFGAPSTNLQLGYPAIGYAVEASDPKGKYTIDGLVKDNNRKLDINLRTSFEVK